MMYPKYAEIKGKKHKINTDFRVALRCFEVIEDESISDTERTLAVIYLLFGFIPDEDLDLFLDKARLFLQCGKEKTESTVKDMDFNADKGYINASFMSDYRIDLSKAKMHFWQYIELINGLTEKCVLSRVREIRNYDVRDIKDTKTRAKILKAQENLALPIKLTKEEQEVVDKFEKLFE